MSPQNPQFVRIEGHNITRARLEAQFKEGITDVERFEQQITAVMEGD